MILQPGRATPRGTSAFLPPGTGRPGLGGLSLSSIGMGTYLGDPDLATDHRYERSAREALRRGCNVLDCAINYRYQRSERALGVALRAALAEGLDREGIVICTKAGFVPLDPGTMRSPERYLETELLAPGIITREDLTGTHVMTPRFLRHQAECSRQNFGMETLDLLYLHNPDVEVRRREPEDFWARLRACLEELERMADEGWIGCYGLATWGALRVPPESSEHLSLARVVELAREVSGGEHHFRAVQAPLNLEMPEAVTSPTQEVGGRRVPLLQAAQELGLTVFASATLAQGGLTARLPRAYREAMPDLPSDAARALQFARSVPGLTTALVGMESPEHVESNLALLAMPPLAPDVLAYCLDLAAKI